MSELSYQAIRTANQAREADEVKTESRKKNLLILVLHYLSEEGYLESANSLSKETNLDLTRYEVCDNIDLNTILMEYESYYYVKFSRYPKVTKKLTQSAGERRQNTAKLTRSTSVKNNVPSLPKIPQGSQGTSPPPTLPPRPQSGRGKRTVQSSSVRRQVVNASVSNGNLPVTNGTMANGDPGTLTLHGLTVSSIPHSTTAHDSTPAESPHKAFKPGRNGQIIDIRAMINDATKMNAEEGVDSSDRLLKPLGGYVGYSSEMRELAQVISREIYHENPNVKWDDIIGLDEAKRLVKEAVVYPIKYPQFFKGILSPWKGLLLYGPPGTGKTLLAKAVATECQTTFFNISASSIVSKWRGDSEKLVRVLFELARFHAPSTIFLDELESLMSQRGSQGGGTEHEGSRRMKTEILVQMDGLAKTDDLVFLLAASNLPWELDHAMLRRLEKRIIVGLPTLEARKAMFIHHLPTVVCSQDGSGLELLAELNYDCLAQKTEGYSGSDIRLVCKEAAMRPVRKIFDILENLSEGHELHVQLDTIRTEDVLSALERTKPSAKHLSGKFQAWQKEFESV
ncbi:katanin p60 ATPase-containing subunit A-like 2 isoform X2 [Gigantopelta aegis]|uniref:katanin p60 ATPase-containing subunit A-like 2 isoform X2 n=1 Tax=Gigantopelta aegis TaxID=1735272 RepID=UPI001B88A1DA|nr:katanin p60 ATPase-containing subunit A-like 2 isoform X2 [Gigantopelta aegis]